MNRRHRPPFRLLLALALAGLASGCLYDPPVYDSAAGYGAVPYGNGYVYDYGYDYGYCGYGYYYNYGSYCSAYWDGWPYWGWGGWDGWWGVGYWGGYGGGYWHHQPTFQAGTTGPGPWNAGWPGHSPGVVAGPGRFTGFHPPVASGFARSGGFRSGGTLGRRGGGGGFRGGGGFHSGGFHGH